MCLVSFSVVRKWELLSLFGAQAEYAKGSEEEEEVFSYACSFRN
jgi:hypothetical protein